MLGYTHRSVTAVSILITVLFFCICNYLYDLFQKTISNQIVFPNLSYTNQSNNNIISNSNNTLNNQNNKNDNNKANLKNTVTNNTENKTNSAISNKTTSNTTKSNVVSNKKEEVNKVVDLVIDDWRIVIPSIGLNAQIAEGTDSDTMDKYVGHFENTAFLNGNVALAGHNRGYPVNYFAKIKELVKGDIVQYYYKGNLVEYAVQTVTVISDTDWSYLENTIDNRITLITCVEDEPEYRRCIQAIQI